jgi:hypothetical protein
MMLETAQLGLHYTLYLRSYLMEIFKFDGLWTLQTVKLVWPKETGI